MHCLSSVQPLTDFFIGDLHEVFLNKTNPMGSGGNVTVKYAELIQQIWSGTENKIKPERMTKTL